MATALETGLIPVTFKTLAGGLNSTAGPLGVADNESSDLQNIEFDKFGSVQPRNGYVALNTSAVSNSGTAHGLYYYRGLSTDYAIMVNNGYIYKMDSLDGQWDNITGEVSFSSGGVDSYTTLMLHMDGDNGGSVFIDSSAVGHTIVNKESHDAYTVLMLHMDGTDGSTTFTDSSLGTHTCTSVNGAEIDTSVYKFSTGSGLFSDTSYVTIPDNAKWDFAEDDFTIDFYARFNSLPALNNSNNIIYRAKTAGSWMFRIALANIAGVYNVRTALNDSVYDATWTTPVENTWYHIAVVRTGTDLMTFIDGTQIGSTETSTDTITDTTIINIGYSSESVNGWLDELHFTKGLARWANNFKVPGAPWGLVGTNTSVKKFGTAGGAFTGTHASGSSRFLSIADTNDLTFSTTDFTIDLWARFNKLSTREIFLSKVEDVNNNWAFFKGEDEKLKMYFNKNASVTGYYMTSSAMPISTDTWYHIAFIRSSTAATIYFNGTSQVTQTASAASLFSTNDLDAGVNASITVGTWLGYYSDFYIDELRVNKGIVRWNGDFTPNSTAYNDSLGGHGIQDFDTFLGHALGAGEGTIPWQWYDGNSTATAMTVVDGLTEAKFVRVFQNYCFMGNVKISGIRYPSRVYWSAIRSITSWDAADWIEVSKDDGDEITGLRVLGDRLVVYKNNSVYIILFTGDFDLPFVVQKTNSAVGCAAPYSIQEAENGHIFASQDGIYFFDGSNSYKLSDRINDTYEGVNKTYLEKATSLYQKKKNRYLISLPSGTSLYNNFVLSWNSYLNAWSKYAGMSASVMATFLIDDTEERPYLADYLGYAYRNDYGTDDYPSNTIKAVNSYYCTNWKCFEDICDNKGFPHLYITHRSESSTVLTLNYGYDFYNGDQYTQSFSLVTTQSVTAYTVRRDLDGRGKFVRFKFSNTSSRTSYRIDGLGTYTTRESKT